MKEARHKVGVAQTTHPGSQAIDGSIQLRPAERKDALHLPQGLQLATGLTAVGAKAAAFAVAFNDE